VTGVKARTQTRVSSLPSCPLPSSRGGHEGVDQLAAALGSLVVDPFPIGVRVMDNQSDAGRTADGGELQHLQVAIGVAEHGDGPAADDLLDGRRLAPLSSQCAISGRIAITGLPPRNSNLVFRSVPTTCSGGMPYRRSANEECHRTNPLTREGAAQAGACPGRVW
jgi:hypothetical protein